MKGQLHARLEVLPEAQRALWSRLRPATDLGFVLYGGTAVALRLGHRDSVDFDFFHHRALDRDALSKNLPFLGDSKILQDQPNALSVSVPASSERPTPVKLSFFGAIDFGRVGKPDVTTDGVLQVASLDDLMATKLKVILQRSEAKDYRDIAAMLDAGAKLPDGLAAARGLFGDEFPASHSIRALTYFKDGDLDELPLKTRKTLETAVLSFERDPKIARAQIVDRSLGLPANELRLHRELIAKAKKPSTGLSR